MFNEFSVSGLISLTGSCTFPFLLISFLLKQFVCFHQHYPLLLHGVLLLHQNHHPEINPAFVVSISLASWSDLYYTSSFSALAGLLEPQTGLTLLSPSFAFYWLINTQKLSILSCPTEFQEACPSE